MMKRTLSFLIGLLILSNFSWQFIQRDQEGLVCCDEFEFAQIAKNLASGNGYSIQSYPPFSPTLLREPVYPLLLSIFIKISGTHWTLLGQIFNLLLTFLTSILLLIISKKFLDTNKAWIPPALFLLSPRVAHYSWTVLSDIVSVFFVLLSTILLMKAFESKQWKMFLLAGMSFGILALTKMALVLFLPGFIFFLLLKKPIEKIFHINAIPKPSKGTIIPILVGFFLILVPWIIRNTLTFHEPVLTIRSGQLLFERTKRYEEIQESWNLSNLIFRDMLPQWNNFANPEKGERLIISPYQIIYGSPRLNAPARFFWYLKETGSELEADRRMVKEAWKEIRQFPFLYIAQLPFEFIKFNYPEIVPGFFGTSTPSRFFFFIILGGSLITMMWMLFSIRGVWILFQKKNLPALYIILFLLYANVVHELLYVTPRYGFVVYPFTIILFTLGITRKEKLFPSLSKDANT